MSADPKRLPPQRGSLDFEAAPVFSIPDAARAGRISPRTVYRLIEQRQLDARKIGCRTVITGASLRAYLAALPAADIRAA